MEQVHINGIIAKINFNNDENRAATTVAVRENHNTAYYVLRMEVDKEQLKELKKIKADIDQNIERRDEEGFKPTYHRIDAEGALEVSQLRAENGAVNFLRMIYVSSFTLNAKTADTTLNETSKKKVDALTVADEMISIVKSPKTKQIKGLPFLWPDARVEIETNQCELQYERGETRMKKIVNLSCNVTEKYEKYHLNIENNEKPGVLNITKTMRGETKQYKMDLTTRLVVPVSPKKEASAKNAPAKAEAKKKDTGLKR